jgi:hypothetical protein
MFILIQNVTFTCVLHVSALLGQSLDMSIHNLTKEDIIRFQVAPCLVTNVRVCVCVYLKGQSTGRCVCI